MTDPLRSWPTFATRVRTRLDEGRETYGDRSFDRLTPELLSEVQAELEDVAGWAFILWTRLERMRAALAAAEGQT